ncbi:hypothetical protein GJAV_G00186500 [Gymnothorax javanicus]|nr:hypothetical protein GJAV_G00186500 [Gymnothorax javanicus]
MGSATDIYSTCTELSCVRDSSVDTLITYRRKDRRLLTSLRKDFVVARFGSRLMIMMMMMMEPLVMT